MNRTVDLNAPGGEGGEREPSPAALATEALTRMSGLFRKEVDLARAEMDTSLRKAAIGAGLLVAAVVIALSALNVLAAALVVAVTALGIDAGWASLIVGGVFALLALILAGQGVSALKSVKLGPQRVAENVKADVRTIRESVND